MKTNSTFVARAAGIISLTACLLLSASALTIVPAGKPTPQRLAAITAHPYLDSGVLWNDKWRGSGTVVRHPKIVASSASIEFDSGTWLKNNRWANRYHSSTHPESSSARQSLRGYWYWSSYAGATGNSRLNLDFVVHYAYENLAKGGYAGWTWSDSTDAHPLNTTAGKTIVGYPSNDLYYMNVTGPRYEPFEQEYDRFFWNSSVSGARGMGGGGVFVWNGSDYRFAGVYVASNADGSLGAGVRAFDQAAFNLMSSAINSAETGSPVTRTFANSTAVTIPDANSTWTNKTLSVSGMPARVTNLKVSLKIRHTDVGDIEVMLTSPAGRTLILQSHSGGSSDDLLITNRDVTSSFANTNPNGSWKLSVRDTVAGDVGTLDSFSLTLTAQN